jgi:hypothetical protein
MYIFLWKFSTISCDVGFVNHMHNWIVGMKHNKGEKNLPILRFFFFFLEAIDMC